MTEWGDLDARARGLATRLLTRETLERLTASPHRAALRSSLAAALELREGVPERSPERLILDDLARRIALLRHWAGADRAGTLRVIFEDEDRRSVRALLRGADQGAPPDARITGLIPTPSLPGTALEALARERSVERVAGRLAETGCPYGPPLVERIATGPFDLFALEVETLRTFSSRALEDARDGVVEAHVRETIDVFNAWSALLSGSFTAEIDADAVFVDGGRGIDREAFAGAARIDDVDRSREAVARAFRTIGSPLWRPFADLALDPTRLEAAVLAARIEALREARLRDPLSAAPLLEYVLRLRAQAADLRRIVWGVALGAPASVVAAGWMDRR